MDNLAFKLKAANTLNTIRGQFDSLKDSSGRTPISIYVRFYFYVACAFLALLSFIAFFTASFIQGLICMIIAFLIAFVELTWLMPPVERALTFFLENFLWRIIAYVILSIPTLISLTTFLGGIAILVGCGGYGYCIYAKEQPILASKTEELDLGYDSGAFEEKDRDDGLLSNYQSV